MDDGLVENSINDYAALEVEDVLKFKELNTRLMGSGVYYGVLVVSGQFASVSEEARALTASSEFQQYTVAKALMAKNFAQKLVINFYLRVNKPAIETRMFTRRNAAIQWLRKKVGEKRALLKA
jgi:hypothetical protein